MGRQLLANIRNLLGYSTPKVYKQAGALALQLKKQAAHENKTLRAVGHSLGGGLTAVACAKAGIKGCAFSSAALGAKTMKRLTPEEKENAKNLVSNYLVEGDLLNNSRFTNAFRMEAKATIPGNRVIIKPKPGEYLKPFLARHSDSHKCYMEVLKAQSKEHNLSSEPPPEYLP
ncbi:hypothetical protein AB835_12900 [Candidatus Endobugula sertula]|uniref:Fungal lipase-like domain-containing protein n=1 Tax=Candidatus Endobugula sertula TaxID=62101 RepID=A0A1D2QM62_9GAMM|nr:hypothetical protein AB835_12900 [Candidatus Endobugula sertula]